MKQVSKRYNLQRTIFPVPSQMCSWKKSNTTALLGFSKQRLLNEVADQGKIIHVRLGVPCYFCSSGNHVSLCSICLLHTPTLKQSWVDNFTFLVVILPFSYCRKLNFLMHVSTILYITYSGSGARSNIWMKYWFISFMWRSTFWVEVISSENTCTERWKWAALTLGDGSSDTVDKREQKQSGL